MSSALKPPSLTPSSGPPQQNSTASPAASSQLNKPMHPQQGTPSTYGQPPSSHMQNLVGLSHGNPNPHPNTAHQPNHYSLNVPNAAQHYMGGGSNQQQQQQPPQQAQAQQQQQPSPIVPPVSNHPVPNAGHNQPSSMAAGAGAGGQSYSSPKPVSFSSSYQHNLGHPPNQNSLPPVSQTLPATQTPPSQQQQTTTSSETAASEKPQSNGTPESKTTDTQENHVTEAQRKDPTPQAQVSQTPDKTTTATADAANKTATPPAAEPKESAQPTAQTQEPEPAKAVEVTGETSPATVPAVEPKATASTAATTAAPPSESRPMDATQQKTENAASTTTTKPSSKADASQTSNSSTEVDGAKEDKGGKSCDDEKESDKASDNVPAESAKPSTVEQEAEVPVTPSKSSEQVSPQTKVQAKSASSSSLKSQRKAKVAKSESESPKSSKHESKATPVLKTPGGKSTRVRTRTQPYQSPLPELEIITKITSTTPKPKSNDERLIVFYKNEFLAVRNSEGGFYICQAVQNIYKSSQKLRIRWLSQDKGESSGEIYTPDFYDQTDFDCILTNLNLERVDKGKYRLPPAEKERTDSILTRSLAAEKGEVDPSLTEEHPDGLDLSLYKEESQLKKRKGTKRKASSPPKKDNKAVAPKKAPSQPKVKKVAPKAAPKKNVVKKTSVAPAAVAAAAAAAVKKAPVAEAKKLTGNATRTDRAKRRNDTQPKSKGSPVVDQKKAKVLAKVVKKTAISSAASNKSQASTTRTKTTAVATAAKGAVRATKRSRK